nr:hypothetical protein [Tanacetum cinerariifolium]
MRIFLGFENGADMNLTNNGISLNAPDNLGFISFFAIEYDGILAHNFVTSNVIDTNYHPRDNMCRSTLCEARYLRAIAANKELCVRIRELRRSESVNNLYCYELQTLVLSRNDEISSYMNEIDHLSSEQRVLMTEIRVLDEKVERVHHGRRRH